MSTAAGATDEERAPLLQRAVHDDHDDHDGSQQENIDRRSLKLVLQHPKLLTTLEQALVLLTIVLLCLAAVFGGLALGVSDKYKHLKDKQRTPILTTTQEYRTTTQYATTTVTDPNPPAPTAPPTHPPSKNDAICLTPLCVQVSAAILDSIDPSIDPCDDFYQFAVGQWLATHPIPAEKGLFGSAQWIDQRNKDLLLRILATPVVEDKLLQLSDAALDSHDAEREADIQNLQDLNTFYTSCMDEDALDRRGSKPLLDIVEEVLSAWRQSKKSVKERMTETLLLLHSKGIDALFASHTQGDYYVAPDVLRLWLSQSGLGLPNPDYYGDADAEKIYKEVIRSALSDVYEHVLLMEDEHHHKSKDRKGKKGKKPDRKPHMDFTQVYDFEASLAKINVDSVDLGDPVFVYNPYNSSGLAKLAPFLDWTNYFSGFAPRAFPMPAIVTTPTYFGNLTSLLQKVDEQVLEAYFVWQTVRSLGPLLGPRETARKEVTQLNNYLSGVEEGVRARREDVCLTNLLDNYGFMVGRYFVQEAFSEKAKNYATTIIKSVITAFKARLPELDWLDESSRKAAEEKADAIGIKIGYATSPNVTQPTSLRNFYAPSRPIAGKYFETVVNARSVVEGRKWREVGKNRDPGAWEMIPSEVNAYYSPEANEMAFPAGILQAPYFSKDYPEYLGFGAMSSLAGHELTHAFDSAGRKFDKTGKLTDWWTPDTIKRYDKLTQCLVVQYGKFYVIGPDGKKYHVQSRVTLGEDIADGGGINQGFKAWRSRFEADPEGVKHDNYILPGLNYTREQLFFIQFARGWARNIKPAEAVRRIRVDEHSPTKFRVLGTLSNSEDFAKAFNCPADSKMNRKHKCKVW